MKNARLLASSCVPAWKTVLPDAQQAIQKISLKHCEHILLALKTQYFHALKHGSAPTTAFVSHIETVSGGPVPLSALWDRCVVGRRESGAGVISTHAEGSENDFRVVPIRV